jgi:hypothetical protein
MPFTAEPIQLSAEERVELEEITKSRTLPAGDVFRVKRAERSLLRSTSTDASGIAITEAIRHGCALFLRVGLCRRQSLQRVQRSCRTML